jgi:CRP/FNR family cyclic AMP-dependent transcriptional regulator
VPRKIQNRGKWSRELLHARFRQQFSVSGDAHLAKAIMAVCTVTHIADGTVILHAGDSNAVLHFILEGTVEIRIKGTLVATRSAGEMIGEIALLANMPRIATVITKGKVVTAELNPESALRIGNAFPTFWMNIASRLARRLSERSDRIRQANLKPTVFLGSSTEDCNILKPVANAFVKKGIIPIAWNDPFTFQPSGTTIEDLLEVASKVDFAILILTGTDLLSSRGKRNQPVPRDNIIFEAGLFMGHLGLDRTILMCERSSTLRIPSDLWGLTSIRFDQRGLTKSKLRLAPAISKMIHRITQLGIR